MAERKADSEQVLDVFRSWLEAMEKYRQEVTTHGVLEMLAKIEKLYAPPLEEPGATQELEFRYPDQEISELWLG